MKWINCLFITHLALFSLTAQQAENPFHAYLSAEKMQEDLSILEQTLPLMHPGYYAYTSPEEMEKVFGQIRSQLRDSLSSMDFYHLVGPLLSLIGDVHTDLEPCPAFYKLLNSEWPVFPLSVIWLEEKLYVSHNLSLDARIKPGDQLLSLNGKSTDSLFRLFRQYVPRDGYNLTSPNHTLGGKYGGFRNFYASFFEPSPIFKVELLSSEGQVNTYELDGPTYSELFERGDALLAIEPVQQDRRQLILELEDKVATLTVKSFHPGKIKDNGQRFKRFFSKAFREINKAGVDKLILDLRGNGGGHESVFMELFSYLHDEPFAAYRELSMITDTIPNSQYFLEQDQIDELEVQAEKILTPHDGRFLLNEPGVHPYEPQKPYFSGELAVLIDGASSSAAGDFAGLLQNYQRAVFVGEELGGNAVQNTAGTRFVLELPHSQLNVIIPTQLYLINNDTVNEGHGIKPDYPIVLSIEDYLEKRDTGMAFAKKILKE